MRVPRTNSICISFLIFAVTGLIVHEAMGPNLCAHYGTVGFFTVAAVGMLIISCLFAKEDKSDSRFVRRVISYILVVAVSVGVWYEIWSIQACNAENRKNVVHQSQ
jgi:ABC-type enterochelin transport system permease subunit